MRNILEKLEELEIDLLLVDILKHGYYLPDNRTILVSNKLDEDEIKEAVLHELKHILSHSEYLWLYNNSKSARSKMEFEANIYMIEELIKENDGYYNYSGMLEEYSLGIGSEDMFKKIEKAY